MISGQIQIPAWPKDDDILRRALAVCFPACRCERLSLPQRGEGRSAVPPQTSERWPTSLLKKSLCSSLWECVGVGRARQSELANERVRGTGKRACSIQANRRPPCAKKRTARGGLEAQRPMSCYQIMPGFNNNSGLFFKAHGRRTNSASILHGSLGEGQQFLWVQHLLTASFASGVVFTDSRGGRDSLAPKVQKYRML